VWTGVTLEDPCLACRNICNKCQHLTNTRPSLFLNANSDISFICSRRGWLMLNVSNIYLYPLVDGKRAKLISTSVLKQTWIISCHWLNCPSKPLSLALVLLARYPMPIICSCWFDGPLPTFFFNWTLLYNEVAKYINALPLTVKILCIGVMNLHTISCLHSALGLSWSDVPL
jgi:hypothetical protein